MSYLLKFMKNIISRKRKSTEEEELEKTNWGRDFGWYIEYEGKMIGELVDAKFEDMFWFTYKLIAYKEHESLVLDFKNWDECKFRYLNKHYQQYAENAFCGGSCFRYVGDDIIISMRALSLNAINKKD